MLKIPSKKSIILSVVLSIAMFAVCAVLAVLMPDLVAMLIKAHDSIAAITDHASNYNIYLFILTLAYLILAVICLADGLLLRLLLRVRAGMVFSEKSVALVRGVSWCCMFLGLVFAALGIYFKIAFVVAFAAVFLGLCVRVVKNVIEEATMIKSENDLTV